MGYILDTSPPPSPSPKHETARSRNSIEKWYIIWGLEIRVTKHLWRNLKTASSERKVRVPPFGDPV